MKDIVNEYMKNNRATDWFGVKRLHCNDGFSMSVQAHDGAYCSPRVDPADTDYYFEVEVGFPSEREELLMEYVEDYDNPTDTVYAYVPVEVVQEVIEKHGGIKGMKDTKELNVGIALLALQSFDEAQVLSEEDYAKTVAMAYRLEKTPLYKDSKDSDNDGHIQQAFALIEEYLKEQGV